MAGVQRLAHPGWCRNLVGAARVEPGERVLVLVDEPLVEEGAQLLAAVKDAGAEPRLELWAGKRPLAHAPPAVKRAAGESTLLLFLSEAPRSDEASARFETSEAVMQHGGRGIFMGFVDGELLRGELSIPGVDLSEAARRLLAELEASREVHVRGRAGTDLRLRVEGRPWFSDALPLGPGDLANYPSGEVFVAPHADGADGVLVADVTVPHTGDGVVDAS